MDKYEVYNEVTGEKLGEFESQEFMTAFMNMVFDSFMIDSLKITKVKDEIAQADVEE